MILPSLHHLRRRDLARIAPRFGVSECTTNRRRTKAELVEALTPIALRSPELRRALQEAHNADRTWRGPDHPYPPAGEIIE